jgi:Ca2+-transporting ATPase
LALWAAGKRWEVSGQGFDPHGAFIDEQGVETTLAQDQDLELCLKISAICNDAELVEKDGHPAVQGNPTEGALVVAAAKAGVSRQKMADDGYQVVKKFPFDSKRKMMSVIIRTPGGELLLAAKGAPDIVLSKASAVRNRGEELPVSESSRQEAENAISDFGGRAMRTLAIAYKSIDEDGLQLQASSLENEFVLLGIHGIMDPPRPEVVSAVAECWSAGIRTVMITGDHAATAQAIAEEIGIRRSEKDLVFTGTDRDAMSDQELQSVAPRAAVYARVTPEHKQRIVQALQANDQVVAMTGDGVNDAPALRNADIGVAMGIAGTAVAKESAALVLLDDNFSTIVAAVAEGRRIYDNIRKFIRQGLTANVAEVSVILFAFMMMGDDPLLPITALMVLWINLVSDGIPALALGLEAPEDDVMARKPRARDESFFADQLGARIVLRGLALGGLSWWLFDFALDRGYSLQYAETIAFTTLIFAQLWVYTPIGQAVFGTEPLSARHLLMVITIASLPTFVLSGIKTTFNLRFL